MTDNVPPHPDVIDAVVPLAAGQHVHALRQERAKVVAATQASYQAMFTDAVPGISVVERLLVALHACRLAGADGLAAHYRERLKQAGADAALVAQVDSGTPALAADARTRTILEFAGKLTVKPIDGDRSAIEALVAAGLGTPAIVALSQLISYLSYQIRIAAGLRALAAATEAA